MSETDPARDWEDDAACADIDDASIFFPEGEDDSIEGHLRLPDLPGPHALPRARS